MAHSFDVFDAAGTRGVASPKLVGGGAPNAQYPDILCIER